MKMTRFRISMAAMLLGLGGTAMASGFDQAAFERLDRGELRAAEARLSELVEPGTARALRAPANEAEAYVIARQQRLAAAMERRHEAVTLASGVKAQQVFWPIARATRITVGSDGQLKAECVSASSLLGHTQPDFRDGNQALEVVR